MPSLRSVVVGAFASLTFVSPFAPSPAAAQQPADQVRAGALRVFLDCNAFPCDFDYFRTEIEFVSWVRDRTLAQVHLIVTSSQTGGGGSIYALNFLGLENLAGDDDSLRVTAPSTNTQDETLTQLSRVIAAGLARYSAAIGQTSAFEINTADARDQDALVSGDQVNDPWNFWVFEISADADVDGEDTQSERNLEGRLEATRTTDLWKIELEGEGSFSSDRRELDNGRVIEDERTDWSTDLLLVRTLAPHWSAGIVAGAGASTSRNQTFGADAAAAVEYSFFPYEESPRRSLTARYDLRMQHYDWEEETIYFQTSETRPQHELQLSLFQRQPWGESSLSVDASQFLHDLGKWSAEVSGNLEFRILRGLNLNVGGSKEWIEDQIFISREDLTDEEILLGRFERPTDSQYSFRIGLSYEFGSIFNNVVNNRFGSRNFGGGNFD